MTDGLRLPDPADLAPAGRVLVTGATGLVGSRVLIALDRAGYRPVPLSRRPRGDVITWDPSKRSIEHERLHDIEAVVHLAGENIAGRWTPEKKRRIRESRVEGTRFLAEVLSELPAPPRVFLQASAVGYYGDRGRELLREDSRPGKGFLAGVCREWEGASQPLESVGVRVARLRIGMVLSTDGGALPLMIRPIRYGVGGRLGSGLQIVSWIERSDLVRAILHVLRSPRLSGAINCVAPETVTNQEMTRKLGRILRRPTLLPLPEWMGRIALGEMADELLFASTRVDPSRLLASGFRFRFPSLDEALEYLLEEEGDASAPRRRADAEV